MLIGAETVFVLLVRQPFYPVGAAAQRGFPQCRQLLGSKWGSLSAWPAQPFNQLRRLDINQLHLIGLVENRIRNPFPGRYAGNCAYGIVKAFDISHIYGGVYVDPGF